MTDGLAHLIARIDEAVRLHDPDAITHRIKRELEMTSCHIFEPMDDGRYVRRERALCYHE